MTKDNRRREPRGIPVGGQFASTRTSESDITLVTASDGLDEESVLNECRKLDKRVAGFWFEEAVDDEGGVYLDSVRLVDDEGEDIGYLTSFVYTFANDRDSVLWGVTNDSATSTAWRYMNGVYNSVYTNEHPEDEHEDEYDDQYDDDGSYPHEPPSSLRNAPICPYGYYVSEWYPIARLYAESLYRAGYDRDEAMETAIDAVVNGSNLDDVEEAIAPMPNFNAGLYEHMTDDDVQKLKEWTKERRGVGIGRFDPDLSEIDDGVWVIGDAWDDPDWEHLYDENDNPLNVTFVFHIGGQTFSQIITKNYTEDGQED